ncbi:hypothetical protein C7M84_005277 [Penaeus vannamei]|uniref:Uncharacterized protein n=1 Tax=Penaeus vannamei TaxID=6689 RepID=A0A423TI66_PENVA|nr:hypothetical protein C7M84_005277 [Penaeus vannamei]
MNPSPLPRSPPSEPPGGASLGTGPPSRGASRHSCRTSGGTTSRRRYQREMRRPSFCCDQHGSGETQCQPQEGGESTLARVRRFLAVSMGARAAGRSPTTRCKHRALPPDPLHAPAHAVHSLLAEMKEAGVGVQGVLGRPLEDVMAAHGEDASGHGVPALVHLLCCYLLTHGVDYDTLVSEDWLRRGRGDWPSAAVPGRAAPRAHPTVSCYQDPAAPYGAWSRGPPRERKPVRGGPGGGRGPPSPPAPPPAAAQPLPAALPHGLHPPAAHQQP